MISPYLIVYLLVAILAILSLANKKYVNVCYSLIFIIMTVFLALRYGQGTDFPAYKLVYDLAPSELDFTNGIYSSNTVAVEYGWWIINNIFKSLGIPFYGLSIFLAVFEMLLVDRFIRKTGFARYKALILLLAFPTFYLTYLFSAFRQGLVLAVFLGFMFPWFLKKKYIPYVLMICVLFFIHKVAIVAVLLLFVDFLSVKQCKYLMVPSAAVGLVSSKLFVPIFTMLGKTTYVKEIGLSPFALLERICMLVVVLYLYKKYEERKNGNEVPALDKVLKFYLLGMCIYLMCLMLPLIGSRVCIFFKVFEIWLIPQMLPSAKKERRVQLVAVLLAITCLMTYKNLNTAISEGGYFDKVTAIKFPYVTIFNQDEITTLRDNKYFHIDVESIKSRY